ncbi:hypothetical protein N7G274_010329 [Stereocaulon virgatum]|uniref:Uncharacterized protein n=1 Tax=Stereocaulon virgatum TaxID=373712 RepID=A0ABR3ZWK7_9LECA
MHSLFGSTDSCVHCHPLHPFFETLQIKSSRESSRYTSTSLLTTHSWYSTFLFADIAEICAVEKDTPGINAGIGRPNSSKHATTLKHPGAIKEQRPRTIGSQEIAVRSSLLLFPPTRHGEPVLTLFTQQYAANIQADGSRLSFHKARRA